MTILYSKSHTDFICFEPSTLAKSMTQALKNNLRVNLFSSAFLGPSYKCCSLSLCIRPGATSETLNNVKKERLYPELLRVTYR